MSSPSPPLTPPSSDSENEAHTSDNECDTLSPSSSRCQSRTQPTSSPHPFAASTKANRAPPLYEKKLFTPPPTPPELSNKIPNIKTNEVRREESRATLHGSLSPDERTQIEWDFAISSAVDGATAKIDLSDKRLTYIPPSLIDLKNLVVLLKESRGLQIPATTGLRPFKRSATAPPLLPSPHISTTRPFKPTATCAVLKPAAALQSQRNEKHSNCEIELYLMCNKIRALPRELFRLDGLVVLSLRQNKLTSLPPAIGKLTALRELNVASNLLTYLPAEILKLSLTSLQLHPNKFLLPPSRTVDTEQTLGTLEPGPPVPALSEIMLRFILGPDKLEPKSSTWLEARLPAAQTIDSLSLPDHFQRIIKASTGHSLASEKGTDAEDDVTANLCPSPVHMVSGLLGTKQVSNNRFYTPAETRLEWVSVVAGVKVAETLQAQVPVLWRGCSRGCLASLLEKEEVFEEVVEDNAMFVTGTGEEGEPFEFSDEE